MGDAVVWLGGGSDGLGRCEGDDVVDACCGVSVGKLRRTGTGVSSGLGDKLTSLVMVGTHVVYLRSYT